MHPECSKVIESEYPMTSDSAVFNHLPMPPSSNGQYVLVRRGNKTYHVPSGEYKDFKLKMDHYRYSHAAEFMLGKHKIQGWVIGKRLLEVNAIFFFKKSRIISKQNTPKKLDVSNRLKALHDTLSTILQIDDCWFFRIYAEKVICQENEEESCSVEILPIV